MTAYRAAWREGVANKGPGGNARQRRRLQPLRAQYMGVQERVAARLFPQLRKAHHRACYDHGPKGERWKKARGSLLAARVADVVSDPTGPHKTAQGWITCATTEKIPCPT